MRPHYDNIINTLVREGIARRNPLFDPKDLDADGVPKQPEALWIPGQEYRVVSFDEMKCDDTTHGSDGDRKGRSERTIRCGPADDGECVGTKHSSHPASVVGGTMGTAEALPCFSSTASESVALSWFANGPVTIVNGKMIPMDGTCNTKGSIDNEAAIEYVKRSVLRAFAARELPTAERKGVIICDGVGSHLSPDFCDFLIANHLILILRTPNCSQKQQPEDLVSFHRVKNAAGVGFYKAKQRALLRMLAEGKTSIPYDVLFGECLKPAWEVGFSPANNREAWRKAGLYENGGISARPYWVQLRAEQPARSKTVTAEARKRAIDALGLERRANYDALTAPWERPMAGGGMAAGGTPLALMGGNASGTAGDTALTLTGGTALTVAAEAADAAEEEDGGGGSGRLTSGELSQLGCAATDPPAQKFLQYKLDIAAVKKMSAAELKEELKVIQAKYTNADEARVTLIRVLEGHYASQPTCLPDGTEVKICWKVRKSWLPKNLLAIMHPAPEQATITQEAPEKKRRVIGMGAYVCGDAKPERPLEYLATSPVQLQLPAPAEAAPAAGELLPMAAPPAVAIGRVDLLMPARERA